MSEPSALGRLAIWYAAPAGVVEDAYLAAGGR
jgi:hypothetical protein